MKYLLADHLGSTTLSTDANGTVSASALYKAFGELRSTPSALGTDYKFTGQREEASLGLYWFSSRFFDPSLGRFTSPDSIVPTGTQGTQAWDRYAFVNNNPVRYNDPTGHQGDSTNDQGSTHGCDNNVADCDHSKCWDRQASNFNEEGSCTYPEPPLPTAACFQGGISSKASPQGGIPDLCQYLLDAKVISDFEVYPGNGTEIDIIGQPTIFIGYSWGGAQVYLEATNADWDISYLILIDPVSLGRNDVLSDNGVLTKPDNVANIYLLMAPDGSGFTHNRYSAGADATTITIMGTTHGNIDQSVSLMIWFILTNP